MHAELAEKFQAMQERKEKFERGEDEEGPAECGSFSEVVARHVPSAPSLDAEDYEWAKHLELCGRWTLKTRELRAMLPVQPAEVCDGIWLGGLKEATDTSRLALLGINCVLNMAPSMCGPSAMRSYPREFSTLDIDADDADEYDLFSEDVPTALAFLDRCRASGRRVLVHCFAGMNRSASVCAAWMISRCRMPLRRTVLQLSWNRGTVLQNLGFVLSLVDFGRREQLLHHEEQAESERGGLLGGLASEGDGEKTQVQGVMEEP